MSNIYIQEPPTHGKIVLKTTVGEIEIELWSRECPKTCRNFTQLCMEGYYDNTIFHRVIPEFIVQGGDPTGTGEGGESIYGQPFKDEFHQRLRFTRRGLVAMANAGKDDNTSQFFFTLGPCTELQKKHTIFAKVAGNTIYNMIKLGESELIDERPIKPHKIISTEVIVNPFDDIEPRNLKGKISSKEDKKDDKVTARAVKNYGLLSFGDEAEEEEGELSTVVKELKNKPKSAHDIGDPYLSSKKVIEIEEKNNKSDKSSDVESDTEKSEEEDNKQKVYIEGIKSKLKKSATDDKVKKTTKMSSETKDEKEIKAQKLKEEIKQLRKELVSNAQAKKDEDEKKKQEELKHEEQIDIVNKYIEDKHKYEHLKRKKIMNAKETKTLELLQSFREKLFDAKNKNQQENLTNEKDDDDDDSVKTSTFKTKNELDVILTHKFELDEEVKQKVIDANVKDNERYDIFDPRNVLNKRKREVSKEVIKEKRKYGGKS